ncbi:Wadjet anti-phage system protein JetD domain-containing protein [Thiobacillus denitrificans]|uniref:Wadjet protein JetD C-terminal domain-containing protein n=1 Tax=Thiobacillus denitrificans TaxID=36861 RepID=A0A125BCX9_THIDE|nr:Wadjet anti-phage system protein JetD domain-containing protein [Thiobacillus denitrificans]KVW96919.1 hypothetical protein ABW22_05685 [Thiobacillus denitrificans]
MTDPALGLLNTLFERWQRSDNSSKTLSLSLAGRDSGGYRATSGNCRESFHAVMANAAACGAVTLEWGRFEAEHELRRVLLVDGHKLAGFLGRTPARTQVVALAPRITLLLEHAPPWLQTCWDNAATRWQRGDAALRLRLPQHAADIERLFKALLAVNHNQQENLDLRSFSVQVTDDSKAMERLKASFAEAWCKAHDCESRDVDDLYHSLGLIKTPQPVLLRGAVSLRGEQTLLDLSEVRPWIGLPGETLANLVLPERPGYVLSIENWTSFARHCREVPDTGFILYTGGFPNPSIQSVFKRLGQELSQATPFYHWGDTDVRGLEIFALVTRLSGREVRPHQMGHGQWTQGRLLIPSEIRTVESLRWVPGIADLANRLITSGVPQDFEQESRSPQTPV